MSWALKLVSFAFCLTLSHGCSTLGGAGNEVSSRPIPLRPVAGFRPAPAQIGGGPSQGGPFRPVPAQTIGGSGARGGTAPTSIADLYPLSSGRAPMTVPSQGDIATLTASIQSLGGSAAFDGLIPFGETGRTVVGRPSELACAEFGPECHWRNELGYPGNALHDELEFTRARGQMDAGRMGLIFGTTTQPSGMWALTGSGSKIAPSQAALLVSDPILCLPSGGELQFRYWTTPQTKIRVCTREPGRAKGYDQCSPDIRGGDPGPARVLVPGPRDRPFEIVIEASGFDFSLLGQSGGAVILDDISYSGEVCPGDLTAVAPVAQPRPLAPFPTDSAGPLPVDVGRDESVDLEACRLLKCSFDDSLCYDPRLAPFGQLASFLPQAGPTGNLHTGIREVFDGGYAVVRGPSPESALRSPPFTLERPKVLQFCFYRASVRSTLRVVATRDGRTEELYSAGPLTSQPHLWTCERTLLAPGAYDSVDFMAENLRNKHSYLAIDEINVIAEDGPVC